MDLGWTVENQLYIEGCWILRKYAASSSQSILGKAVQEITSNGGFFVQLFVLPMIGQALNSSWLQALNCHHNSDCN